MNRDRFVPQRRLSSALALLCLSLAGPMLGGEHPSLVDPATTKCITCHADRLAGPVVHPPANDDCMTCHEFSKDGKKTRVALASPQSELCTMCHGDLADAAAGKLTASHFPVTDACTNCHNPHSSKQQKLLIGAVPPLCLTCHDGASIDPKHGRTVSRSDCRGCHLPHGSANAKLLKAAAQHPPFADKNCQTCHKRGGVGRADKGSARVCYACHAGKEDKFAKGVVHTIVRQGRCEGCHDPHLSDKPKFLLRSQPELCLTCHSDVAKKLAGASAHPPAKDDCSTCHDPHRSDNPYQLSDAPKALCATCHDTSDKDLSRKHLGADLTKADCLGCHDPHGSTEKSLILARSVHPPFAERSCEVCHEEGAKLGEGAAKDTCLACHSEAGDAIGKAAVQHPAMEIADCSTCHSPHASAQAKLIREPAGGECFACHDDKKAATDEVQHGVIAMFGCESCHEPHGGSRAKLLRDDVDQLCLSCHDGGRWKESEDGKTVTLAGRFEMPAAGAEKIRTLKMIGADPEHPITGHRALGTPTEKELAGTKTKFRGSLSCLTCHDPHKGKSRQLFAGGKTSAMEVCLACHEK
ncbi:MAG: cytochrome c3 family protein [Thermoanaerobaculia bacterium]